MVQPMTEYGAEMQHTQKKRSYIFKKLNSTYVDEFVTSLKWNSNQCNQHVCLCYQKSLMTE